MGTTIVDAAVVRSSKYTFATLCGEVSAQKSGVRRRYAKIGKVVFGESYIEVFEDRTRLVTPYVVKQPGGTVHASETTAL